MSRRPVLLALVGVGLATALGACGTAHRPPQPVDRVLIVSLPGVRWADVVDQELPNLERFAGTAAIGDLSTRIGRRPASTTDAYLSIGAGTRALAPSIDVAVAVDPDERYAGVPTSDILERRLGRVPTGIAYLPVGAAIERNERSSYGAEPGRLGDLLADAEVHRSVIANADAAEGFVSDEPPPDGAYARGAATALMGRDGIVPGGTVGRGLLQEDPAAPFGRRLDHDKVLAAFDTAWNRAERGVVLVEASDLSRAAAYAPRATEGHRRRLRAAALADADVLLGELLARVDLDRDAVLVLSPVAATSSPELAVAALAAPGVDPGLLRSSTTRRNGYVQLADVAPTVLDLFGLDQPEEIEGRAFEVSDDARAGRIARLVDAAEDAEFRDGLMTKVVPGIIAFLALLLAAWFFADRLPPRVRTLLVPGALAALGFVPATYVVAKLDPVRGSLPGYLLAVVVVATLIGVAGSAIERRRPGLGAIAVLGAIAALFTIDVAVGAPLQLNSVFGYSVAVAGRFAGFGNLTFALFGATAVLLAVLLADRLGPRGVRLGLALLGVVVLVEGLPMLGADVGGVLSMVPAFGVTALVLTGRKVRWVHLVGLGAAAIVAVLLFAFLDVARAEGSRTHLARLAQHVVDGRWGPFFDSLGRRLQASFGSAELAAWAVLAGLAVGAVVYAVLVARRIIGPDAPRRTPDPHRLAGGVGLALLAAIGLVANDSSIAVPTTMLIVLVPVIVLHERRPPRVGTS